MSDSVVFFGKDVDGKVKAETDDEARNPDGKGGPLPALGGNSSADAESRPLLGFQGLWTDGEAALAAKAAATMPVSGRRHQRDDLDVDLYRPGLSTRSSDNDTLQPSPPKNRKQSGDNDAPGGKGPGPLTLLQSSPSSSSPHRPSSSTYKPPNMPACSAPFSSRVGSPGSSGSLEGINSCGGSLYGLGLGTTAGNGGVAVGAASTSTAPVPISDVLLKLGTCGDLGTEVAALRLRELRLEHEIRRRQEDESEKRVSRASSGKSPVGN